MTLDHDYNLNTVKEIQISEEFLTLDKDLVECQNEESHEDCATRKYLETIEKDCGCLPFNIRTNKEVFLS